MSLGIYIYTKLFCDFVGKDEFGNSYFKSKSRCGAFDRERRLIVYQDILETSCIDSEWFLWLHHQNHVLPEAAKKSHKNNWDKPCCSNLTGAKLPHNPKKISVKRFYKSWGDIRE